MAERLGTVADYIKDVRVLLLDTIQPPRYKDPELLVAFNTALLEGRRLRADLFITKYGARVPAYESVDSEEVPIEPQFRLAFVYGTVAHALLRDTEDIQDQRASTFRDHFESILCGAPVTAPIRGGTPGGPVSRGQIMR